MERRAKSEQGLCPLLLAMLIFCFFCSNLFSCQIKVTMKEIILVSVAVATFDDFSFFSQFFVFLKHFSNFCDIAVHGAAWRAFLPGESKQGRRCGQSRCPSSTWPGTGPRKRSCGGRPLSNQRKHTHTGAGVPASCVFRPP